MLSCKTVSEKVSEGMDRPLTLMDRLSVRLHLLMCPACRRFEQQLTILRAAIQSLWRGQSGDASAGSDERLTDEARNRIRDALR